MDSAPEEIGITCNADHVVFSVVAAELRDRGYGVTFFDAEQPVDAERLEALSLFVSKTTRPASVTTLLRAERMGVPTWNSATGVLACVSRFSQLCVLGGVGFAVPSASRSKPDGEYVAKNLYHWNMNPVLNGEGDVYEEYLPAEPIDDKYYLVNDGTTCHASVLRATSKLFGQKRIVGDAEPVRDHIDRIQTLMERLEMRAIGVDVIQVDDAWYAVDLNPCPSFKQTGLEDVLADSIESSLVEQQG